MVTPFIVVGSINFDTVTTVERIPGRHEKVRAELTRDALGGAAANTASWLARLGCNVRIYGSVGNDDNGSRCLRWLNEAGVDTSHVAIDADSPTGRAFCISTTTDKRIVTSGGPKLPPIAEAIAKEVPQHGGVIHIATSETEDLINVCRAATDVGWTVSIELNGRDMSELRQLATLAFLNRDELERTFSTTPSELGPENLDSVLPRSESVLIITLGRSGALSVERTGVSTAPTAADSCRRANRSWRCLRRRISGGICQRLRTQYMPSRGPSCGGHGTRIYRRSSLMIAGIALLPEDEDATL